MKEKTGWELKIAKDELNAEHIWFGDATFGVNKKLAPYFESTDQQEDTEL